MNFTKSKESGIPLWSHQSDALDFVKSKFDNGSRGCLLGMEMGTGKTRVAIEFLAYALSNHSIKKILVVAPKSVVCVWESEIEKFWPEYANNVKPVVYAHKGGSAPNGAKEAKRIIR